MLETVEFDFDVSSVAARRKHRRFFFTDGLPGRNYGFRQARIDRPSLFNKHRTTQ